MASPAVVLEVQGEIATPGKDLRHALRVGDLLALAEESRICVLGADGQELWHRREFDEYSLSATRLAECDGHLYVAGNDASSKQGLVHVYQLEDGVHVRTIDCSRVNSWSIRGLAVESNRIYVSNGNMSVFDYDRKSGEFIGDFGELFQRPEDIAVVDGLVCVASSKGVSAHTPDGATQWEQKFNYLKTIASFGGFLYVAASAFANPRLLVLSPAGETVSVTNFGEDYAFFHGLTVTDTGALLCVEPKAGDKSIHLFALSRRLSSAQAAREEEDARRLQEERARVEDERSRVEREELQKAERALQILSSYPGFGVPVPGVSDDPKMLQYLRALERDLGEAGLPGVYYDGRALGALIQLAAADEQLQKNMEKLAKVTTDSAAGNVYMEEQNFKNTPIVYSVRWMYPVQGEDGTTTSKLTTELIEESRIRDGFSKMCGFGDNYWCTHYKFTIFNPNETTYACHELAPGLSVELWPLCYFLILGNLKAKGGVVSQLVREGSLSLAQEYEALSARRVGVTVWTLGWRPMDPRGCIKDAAISDKAGASGDDSGLRIGR